MNILSRIRKGSQLFMQSVRGDSATIFKGSEPTRKQKPRSSIPRDTKKELTPTQWRSLLSHARNLYAQMGEVRGAVNEKATYAVGNAWIPQFYGKDKKWGNKAEAWLWEWMKVCDVRGSPYDFHASLRLDSIHVDRDGDICTLLTETADHYPQLQQIPSHRIGSRGNDYIVQTGPYKGLRICNGIITNQSGRTVAYHVLGDLVDGTEDTYVSARDMLMLYEPDWCDQNRGITAFYHAILSLMDTQDVHEYTLVGIKKASTVDLIEHNEDGELDTTKGYVTKTTETAADGTEKTVVIEDSENHTRFFRAGTGSKLETIDDNRPSQNTSEFLEKILRGCYQGIEWPYEFTRDASKLGGANVRLIVGKARRTIEKRQMLLGMKAVRTAGYAISKAIKLGLLPPSDEWWMWDWQMPAEITVDNGRDAQQDREDYKMGLKTLRDIYGKQGKWWEDEVRQRVIEAKFIEEESARENVDIRRVQLLTPNESQSSQTTQTDQNP